MSQHFYNLNNFKKIFLVTTLALSTLVWGCTKKPSQDELSRLEESKSAAESAEKKLSELRQQRISLENELNSKKDEIKKLEKERDNLNK